MSKTSYYSLILFILFTVILLEIYVEYSFIYSYEYRNVIDYKNVLLFSATSYFGNWNAGIPRLIKQCKEWCHWTSNISHLPLADAVLFHSPDFNINTSLQPPTRKLSIPYVLWTQESPINYDFNSPENYINWTMTYDKRSDIYIPYGYQQDYFNKNIVLEDYWNNKKSYVDMVWLASNCNATNARTQLLEALLAHGLKIDVFGKCGRPINCNNKNCIATKLSGYKFYFAVENSNCRDYVTEKLYNSFKMGLVPIVLKGDIYTDIGISSNSYISVDSFTSITQLAEYINRVANNKELYLSYHKWRNRQSREPQLSGFCDLCHRLRSAQKDSQKSYENTSKWLREGILDRNIIRDFLNQ